MRRGSRIAPRPEKQILPIAVPFVVAQNTAELAGVTPADELPQDFVDRCVPRRGVGRSSRPCDVVRHHCSRVGCSKPPAEAWFAPELTRLQSPRRSPVRGAGLLREWEHGGRTDCRVAATFVAVGTPVDPARPARILYEQNCCIRLLPRMHGVEAHVGVWMQNAGAGIGEALSARSTCYRASRRPSCLACQTKSSSGKQLIACGAFRHGARMALRSKSPSLTTIEFSPGWRSSTTRTPPTSRLLRCTKPSASCGVRWMTSRGSAGDGVEATGRRYHLLQGQLPVLVVNRSLEFPAPAAIYHHGRAVFGDQVALAGKECVRHDTEIIGRAVESLPLFSTTIASLLSPSVRQSSGTCHPARSVSLLNDSVT